MIPARKLYVYKHIYVYIWKTTDGAKRRHSYLEVWGQIQAACNRTFWNWYPWCVCETFDVQRQINCREVGWTEFLHILWRTTNLPQCHQLTTLQLSMPRHNICHHFRVKIKALISSRRFLFSLYFWINKLNHPVEYFRLTALVKNSTLA